MMSERDADFTAASTAKRLVEAEAQLKFYRDREEHFARVLAVSDGGQYRADWDSRIRAIIAERDRAIGDAKRLEHPDVRIVEGFKFGVKSLRTVNAKIRWRSVVSVNSFLIRHRLRNDTDSRDGVAL